MNNKKEENTHKLLNEIIRNDSPAETTDMANNNVAESNPLIETSSNLQAWAQEQSMDKYADTESKYYSTDSSGDSESSLSAEIFSNSA